MSRDPLVFASGSAVMASEFKIMGDVQQAHGAVQADRLVSAAAIRPASLLSECTLVVRKQFQGTRILIKVNVPVLHTGGFTYARVGWWIANPEHTLSNGAAVPDMVRIVSHDGLCMKRYSATGILDIDRFAVGSFAVMPVIEPDTSGGDITYVAGETVDIWAREII